MHQSIKCLIDHAVPLQAWFAGEGGGHDPDREMSTAFMRMADMQGTVIDDLQGLRLQLLLQSRADPFHARSIRHYRLHTGAHGNTLRKGLTLTLA